MTAPKQPSPSDEELQQMFRDAMSTCEQSFAEFTFDKGFEAGREAERTKLMKLVAEWRSYSPDPYNRRPEYYEGRESAFEEAADDLEAELK